MNLLMIITANTDIGRAGSATTPAAAKAVEISSVTSPLSSLINKKSSFNRGTSSSPRPRLSVSFANKTRVFLIPSQQGEKDKLWRTEAEIEATEQDTVRTVRIAISKKVSSGDDEDVCERGLESLVCGLSQRVSNLRHRADMINAVLDAQEEEWEKGRLHADPDLLRATSMKYSAKATEKAYMLGASDEAYVRRMLRRQRED